MFLLFDTHSCIVILKDNKRIYSCTICYEESTFGAWNILFPEVTQAGNIWVTLKGHKISINCRLSGLSVGYSKTQHSKWQLWLRDDHLSYPSLTSSFHGAERPRKPVRGKGPLWKISTTTRPEQPPIVLTWTDSAWNLHFFWSFLAC